MIFCKRRNLWEEILGVLVNIEKEIKTLADSIVTREQFDAALTAAVTTIGTALADLVAAVAAGKVTTQEDFSSELSKLQVIVSGAVAADPGTPVTVQVGESAPEAAQ